jgi:predicted permease
VRRLLQRLGIHRPSDRQLDEEIRAHLDLEIAENIEAGMTAEEARRAALRAFGSVGRAHEEARAAWRFPALDALAQDSVLAIRLLRRTPMVSAVAVLSLAIGIGANTAIFTLTRALLFRPLAVADPASLVLFAWSSGENVLPPMISGFTTTDPRTSEFVCNAFPFDFYEEARARSQTLTDLIAFGSADRAFIRAGGDGEMGPVQIVSGNYFRALGVAAAAGRTLVDADDARGATPAAVISHRFWQREFGGSPSAIGAGLSLNASRFTIVGVAPPGFAGTLQVGTVADVYIPIAHEGLLNPPADGERSPIDDPGQWWLQIMGRLRPAVDAQQARAELATRLDWHARALAAGREVDIPRLRVEPGGRGPNELRSELEQPLRLLSALVGLVLAIACSNLANLLLARTRARQREIAMRLALGASRARIVRQMLTESAVLALAGGAAGLLVANWMTPVLLAAMPAWAGRLEVDLRLDPWILGFTTVLSFLTVALFGIGPALGAARVQVWPAIKEGDRHERGRGRMRAARFFVVAQLAISLLLTAAAGLFARTLQNLERFPTGITVDGLLLARVEPRLARYPEERLAGLYDEILRRVARVPGVTRAGLSRYRLLSNSSSISDVRLEGTSGTPGFSARSDRLVYIQHVGGGFFDALRLPLVSGRSFTDRDSSGSPAVVIVNERLAEREFPGQNPLGRRIAFGGRTDPFREIVGVVKNSVYTNVRQVHPAIVYVPFRQGLRSMTAADVLVRTSGDPVAAAAGVRRAIQSIDPELPVADITTQRAQLDASVLAERVLARVAILFGGVAMFLACIGLYGVASAAVARRTSELGIRMALGADRRQIVRLVLGDLLALVVPGAAAGLLAAALSLKLVRAQLFGLEPQDPATLAAAVATLLLVAALAAWAPARRAARVDPLIALRAE